MRLSGIRAISRSFRHPLHGCDLPEPIPDEDKAALILKIKEGDKEAINFAILSHVKLGMQIAGRYMMKLGNTAKSDDLVSSAIEGICHAVDHIKNEGLEHDNLTGYIVDNIHRFISEYLETDKIILIPARTVRQKRKKGEEAIRPPSILPLDSETLLRESDYLKKGTLVSEIELREILGLVIRTEMEQSIIDLRSQGFKDEEIALHLGVVKSTIYKIRRELEKRFLEIFNGR